MIQRYQKTSYNHGNMQKVFLYFLIFTIVISSIAYTEEQTRERIESAAKGEASPRLKSLSLPKFFIHIILPLVERPRLIL